MEIWRPIKGYEGHYEVSSLGRVRSLDRMICGKRKNSTILKPRISISSSHEYVLSLDSKLRRFVGHKLVADAFLKPLDFETRIIHKDGDRCNNAADNLEWYVKPETPVKPPILHLDIPETIVKNTKKSPFTDEDIADRLLDMYDNDKPIPVICRKLNISYNDAVKYLRRWTVV